MTREAHFMLLRRAGISDADFQARIRAVADQAKQAGLGADWVTLVPAQALSALPHVAESGHDRAPDILLTLTGEEGPLIAAAKTLGPSIVSVSDATLSRLSAGRRHPILPGDAPIRLFFGLRRLERLTRAQFHDYWYNVHAEFGRRLIPPYTYHQIHAEEKLTDELSRVSSVPASPLDGIVEVHFPDVDALIRQLMRPDVASEALVDERNFIDHARSAFHVYGRPANP